MSARCLFAWTSPSGDHYCGDLADHGGNHRCREHPASFIAVGAEPMARGMGWNPRWETPIPADI